MTGSTLDERVLIPNIQPEDITLLGDQSDAFIIKKVTLQGLTAYLQGELSADGVPSRIKTHEYAASGSLSALRIVTLNDSGKLRYADNGIDSFALGITQDAVVADAFPTLVVGGLYEDSSWSFSPNQPLYLGNAGFITQTFPSSGWLVDIGYAVTATQIKVNIQSGIEL